MSSLLTHVAITQLVALAFVTVALAISPRRRRVYAAGFLLAVAVEAVAVQLPIVLDVHPRGVGWNWTGRLLSLVWVAVVWWRGPFDRRDLGLVRPRPGTLPWAVAGSAVLLVVVGLGVATGDGPSAPDLSASSFVYQGVLSVLAEELVHRGVLLCLLAAAVGGLWPRVEGRAVVTIVVAIAIASSWALANTLVVEAGAVRFDDAEFVGIVVARSVFVWLRLYTGSLLVPMAVNATGNVSAFLLLRFVA